MEKNYSNLSAFDLLKMNKIELKDLKKNLLGIEEKDTFIEDVEELISEIDKRLEELDKFPEDNRTLEEKIEDEFNVLKESIKTNEVEKIFNSFMFLSNQNVAYDEWINIKDLFKDNKISFKKLEKMIISAEEKADKQFKDAIINEEKLENLTRVVRPASMRLMQNFYCDRKIRLWNAKSLIKNLK